MQSNSITNADSEVVARPAGIMIKHLSLLWMGSVLGAGAAFLTQVILARQLGPADFGIFAAALATISLVAPLAAFGIGGFWLKAFGKEGWSGLRWVKPAVLFSILSTIIVMAMVFAWALMGPHDEYTSKVFMALSLFIAGQAVIELVSARLQLEERYSLLALWQLLPHALRLLLVLALSLYFDSQLSVMKVVIAYAVVSTVLLAFGAPLIKRMMRGDLALKGHDDSSFRYTINEPSVFALLRNSWPFGLAGFFYLIYYQIDIVLLKYLAGDMQAGIYNVAFVIMTAVYLFPSVIYQRYLMPKIHRWANHDRSRLHRTFIIGNKIMLLFGIVALLVLITLSSWGINLIFGERYESASYMLMMLALAAPFRFVSASPGAVLMTREHINKKILVMGIIAVLNVIFNILLIPILGAIGSAIATVICEVLLLLAFFLIIRIFKII